MHDDGHLTCLDISPTWLAEAKRRLGRSPNVDFLLGDAREIGLPEAAFDVVIAHYVLHDIDRPALAPTVIALARSIRPGGRFVAVEPMGSRHTHAALSADDLVAVMSAAGLREVSREEMASIAGRAMVAVFRRPE